MDIESLVRKNIRAMKPYKSARSEFKGSAEIFIDANENPFENGFNRYPDPLQKQLKEELGKIKDVDPAQIMLGNGSDEIIDLLIRIFCNPGVDSIYTFEPSFGMFDVAAALNDIKIFKYRLNKDFYLEPTKFLEDIPLNCKLVFLCSPNNPTGNSIPLSDIIVIAESFKGMVVVDEAYIDFSDHESALSLLGSYQNLIVTQTFSKAFGAAGLRIGMAYADPYVIGLLHKVKMPYNVSKANQEAGLARLLKYSELKEEVETIKRERERIRNELQNNPKVTKIYPSDANFLLIQVPDADKYYQKLIKKGIVVRNRSSLFGCNNCLRISIGTIAENDVLLRFFNDQKLLHT